MASAEVRLRAADAALADGFPSVAASAAYYAALYAARAALSEEDRHSKTHSGTWSLFGELLVAPGRLDTRLFTEVRRVQEVREAADYDAREIPNDQAREIVAAAEKFVRRVAEMLAE
jgi:uncharacterized protein (UPF0332 family)